MHMYWMFNTMVYMYAAIPYGSMADTQTTV